MSHAIIGKFVYLRYLRDRGILSDERLAQWGLKYEDIFGRRAKKASLEKLTEALDAWLNGDVFPLPWSGEHAPKASHIQRVAAVFIGDELTERRSQFHLDFGAYDFSYIPIETLSLVYEQFLHTGDSKKTGENTEPADGDDGADAPQRTKGRTEGAYYTPLPLVNFMLAEMENRHPLRQGMKVFDPSCGSGAFLVQAYRKLIEKTYPMTKPRPKPSELRELLRTSIFGCDVDGDACQVTQLSLLLTLLDYVEPPDLSGSLHAFKLPSLVGKNIFEGNFFGVEPQLRAAIGGNKAQELNWRADGFDWVVGNPPWKQIRPKTLSENDEPVWAWMTAKANVKNHPVGMNQAAQAFAWEAPRYLASSGECGLLVPAMGLFEEPSQSFRQTFFQSHRVHMVANFANLAEVLFDGRSRVPAAAIFYRARSDGDLPQPEEIITTYSPFIANQEATRPLCRGERGKLWSLVINGSEVRALELGEVASGSGLPWKLAMWGTPWDERLIKRLERKWDSLKHLEAPWHSKHQEFVASEPHQILCVSEGLQLREISGDDVEPADEASGKLKLEMAAVDRLRSLFYFPRSALVELPDKQFYARKGRLKLPLTVSKPPHVIVSAARNFAVYSEEFILVPPRQIGITSRTSDKDFLKALSLFLSSDFAFYHQFIRSTELGVKRDRATLEALRQMPIPLSRLPRSDLREWAELHTKLAKCPPRSLDDEQADNDTKQGHLFEKPSSNVKALLKQLNEMTAQALGLNERERALIHDLVQVRYALNDGKLGDAAMRHPTEGELRAYASRLKRDLDSFVGLGAARRHRITIVRDDRSALAMVEIDFTTDYATSETLTVLSADSEEAAAFAETRSRLLRQHAQWVYFNRNLRIYRGRQTYIVKPLHRVHWTESTAMMDAGDVIAETLAGSWN